MEVSWSQRPDTKYIFSPGVRRPIGQASNDQEETGGRVGLKCTGLVMIAR